MIKRNMGRADRGLRLIAGLGLALIGLFALGGWLGVLAVAVGVVLLVTSLSGFCPLYIPLGISTLHGGEKPADAGRGQHAHS